VIVDTSALLAILLTEPDSDRYARAIEDASIVRLSAGTYLEAGIVADTNRDPVARRVLDALLERAGIILEPVTAEQARIGREAYRDFGKGSGHPAQLNFGDCFSYALARSYGEPLLYKGNDFGHTDVRSALPDS
jgi:ribonuclease VapC